ncbi:MAG: hypothetical protein WC542_13170, partial [Paludibacter sp.]
FTLRNIQIMLKQTTNTKSSFLKNPGSSDDSLVNINMPSIIENMKHYYLGSDEDLNSRILLKSQTKNVILTVAHRGTEIESFQSADSVTFQILEGKLRLRTRRNSVLLNKGQHLTLNEKIKYSLTTTEDSAFLLTIANKTPQI